MKLTSSPSARADRRWQQALVALGAAFWLAAPLAAQTPPPATGTVALEGTMKRVYRATNVVIVATLDGVEHVYRLAKDLVVHGGKAPEALEGLREGTTVVVHYSPEGAESLLHEIDRIDREGLEPTEGVVTRIDRGRRQITLRYDNGRTETFQLTERAATEESRTDADLIEGRVVIYYSNEAGRKVAHYYRRVETRR